MVSNIHVNVQNLKSLANVQCLTTFTMLNHPYPPIGFQPICCTFKSYLSRSGQADKMSYRPAKSEYRSQIHMVHVIPVVFSYIVFPILCGTNARSQDLGGLATITSRFCWSCATALLRSPTWRNSRSLSKDSWDAGDWKADLEHLVMPWLVGQKGRSTLHIPSKTSSMNYFWAVSPRVLVSTPQAYGCQFDTCRFLDDLRSI